MLNVGDVFKGKPNFRFGRSRSVGKTKYRPGIDVVMVSDSFESTYLIREVKSYDRKSGKPNYVESRRHAHDDKTRPNAEFVVENVSIEGGSDREGIPNEPHIIARRLAKDGTYDPQGELITFVDCPSTTRSNFTNVADVTVVRKMVKTTTFT